MAKAHRYFIGAGCLLIVFGVVIFALLVRGLSAPSLPSEMVLSLRLAGPIAEVTAKDPLAELMGEQATSLRKLREALVRAAEDDRVQGVRLRVDSIGGGFATAQEIRSLIVRVGAAGKWTAAYMDTAGEFSSGNLVYYVASACDEVVMNPQGDLNFIGLSAASPGCQRPHRSSAAPLTSSISAPSFRVAVTTRPRASCIPKKISLPRRQPRPAGRGGAEPGRSGALHRREVGGGRSGRPDGGLDNLCRWSRGGTHQGQGRDRPFLPQTGQQGEARSEDRGGDRRRDDLARIQRRKFQPSLRRPGDGF